MNIVRIPAFRDNYLFLLEDPARASAAAVDPGDAQPILHELTERGLTLTAIFNTHHHPDHSGGNLELLRHFPNAVVYGGDADWGRIPGQQVRLNAGDTVTFAGETATIFFIPGHTSGHIAYYFPQSGHLFCGDTLFGGGCGRLFEGTPAQMLHSLDQLRQLPEETQVWCAHEYTLKNLEFAVTVDPHNPDLQTRLQAVQTLRQRGEATIPSQIGLEKRTNPFLRWDNEAIQAAAQLQDPVRVFARIRGKKDLF